MVIRIKKPLTCCRCRALNHTHLLCSLGYRTRVEDLTDGSVKIIPREGCPKPTTHEELFRCYMSERYNKKSKEREE